MALAAFVGSATAGHTTYPPSTVSGGATKTLIEGVPASRTGDPCIPHINTSSPYDFHMSKIGQGSSKVNIEGSPAAGVGTPLDCNPADSITSGASKVNIGGI